MDEIVVPERPTTGPSQDDLNRFAAIISRASEQKAPGTVPEVEVPRRVIEYYNQRNLKGFEEAGYFIYNGVKVFEKGKREQFRNKDNESMEKRLHGG